MINDSSIETKGGRDSRAFDDDDEGQPVNHSDSPGQTWTSKFRDAEYRGKFIRNIWTYMCIFSVGLISGQMGPSFLDMQLITRTTVQQASAFFTAASAGNMVGSVLSGVIYDHVSKDLLLIVSMLLMGLMTLVLPFCSRYWLMVVACFLLYVFRQSSALVCNADVLRIWGAGASPYMQALHFVFAVGGIVAPLVTEPFLAPRNRTTTPEDRLTQSPSGSRDNSTPYHLEADNDLDLDAGITRRSWEVETATLAPASAETQIHFAFIICCLVCFLTLVPFVVEYLRDRCGKRRERSKHGETEKTIEGKPEQRSGACAPEESDERDPSLDGGRENCSAGDRDVDGRERTETDVGDGDGYGAGKGKSPETAGAGGALNLPTVPYVVVVIWVSLFYLVYLGAQLTSLSYLATFAVLQLQWSKSQGAILTSFLWVSLAVSRFVCIFLAKCLSPVQFLVIAFAVFVPSLLGFTLMSLRRLDWGVWLCTGLCGAAMSPIYAGTFSWMHRSLVPVTGKVNSCIDLASNAGVLTTLTVLGYLIENQGAIWIAYVMIGEATLSFFIFLSLFLFSRFCLRPKYGAPSERELEVVVSFTSDNQLSEQLEHCIKDA